MASQEHFKSRIAKANSIHSNNESSPDTFMTKYLTEQDKPKRTSTQTIIRDLFNSKKSDPDNYDDEDLSEVCKGVIDEY